MTRDLLVRRVRPGAILPTRAHPTDAGLDLHTIDGATLEPGERRLMRTGIAIGLRETGSGAHEAHMLGRENRDGLSIVNTPGVIDEGYSGELHVNVLNTSRTARAAFAAGDRIAQLLVVPVSYPRVVEVDVLDVSERGDRGHGSTGY